MMNMNDRNAWLADTGSLAGMNDRNAWLSGNQEPWWKSAQTNMQDPKQQVMMALLARQLSKAGQGLAGGPPAPMRGPQAIVPGFDLYGNPVQ